MEQNNSNKPKVSNALITNYGLSNSMNTIAFTVPTLFLTMFMTDYLGISPLAVANGMLIARLVDFFVSIIAGAVIEKSNMKHGKYLSWLRLTTITLFFGNVVQMLDTSAFVHNTTIRLVIVMIAYMFFHCSMNFAATCRAAILPKYCGADMELRKKFTARQAQIAAAAGIISSAITLPLVNFVSRVTGQESLGYFVVALIFSSLFVVLNVIYLKQSEPFDPYVPADAATAKKTPTIGQMFSSLFTNKQMLVLFICLTLHTMGSQLYTGLLTYYFRLTGTFDSYYTVALTIRSVVQLGATFVIPPLARKLGKKGSISMAWLLSAACLILARFLAIRADGSANVIIMIIAMSGVQSALSFYMSFAAVYWLDCGEYGYYTTGVDNRTMSVTVMNWPTKIGFMVGGSMVGWMLTWAGYVVPEGATIGTVASMSRFMTAFTLIPAICSICAAVGILMFYKLTDAEAAKYAKANVEREAAAAAAAKTAQ